LFYFALCYRDLPDYPSGEGLFYRMYTSSFGSWKRAERTTPTLNCNKIFYQASASLTVADFAIKVTFCAILLKEKSSLM